MQSNIILQKIWNLSKSSNGEEDSADKHHKMELHLKVMDEKPKNHQTTVILNKKHVIPYE